MMKMDETGMGMDNGRFDDYIRLNQKRISESVANQYPNLCDAPYSEVISEVNRLQSSELPLSLYTFTWTAENASPVPGPSLYSVDTHFAWNVL